MIATAGQTPVESLMFPASTYKKGPPLVEVAASVHMALVGTWETGEPPTPRTGFSGECSCAGIRKGLPPRGATGLLMITRASLRGQRGRSA